jgi:60 kDa SS-A/Ro ribonucleoprotein
MQLERFLLIGVEGPTYYESKQDLVIQNAEATCRCIDQDGVRVVNRVVEVSDGGLAVKNDPALFVLAICAGQGNIETRNAAMAALPKVARTATHLFTFLNYVQSFRGWGRGLRRAVASWYNDKDADHLAYQVVKYRQRNGWTHLDAIRLAHPRPATDNHNAIYAWLAGKEFDLDDLPEIIQGFGAVQGYEALGPVLHDVEKYRLPWEAIPTQFLREPRLWEEMLPNMPLTAMVRNLGRMTNIGLLDSYSNATKVVLDKLNNVEWVHKSRYHPLNALVAQLTYAQGRGSKGKMTWKPVKRIVDALDKLFYTAFGCVEPTGKNFLLAVDVSSSMTWDTLMGIKGLTPRAVSAALALVTANVEPHYEILGFAHGLRSLNITPGMRLDQVIYNMNRVRFGATDCSLPFVWAVKNAAPIDMFVLYTDSETNCGVHPAQALQQHRDVNGRPNAGSVVAAMTSAMRTVADPSDPRMVDVVGFSASLPQIISTVANM